MTDVQWAQTRTRKSWHIADPDELRRMVLEGLCGKRLDPETLRDERPGHEKTCETCLRIGGPR